MIQSSNAALEARLKDLQTFYGLLDRLSARLGGSRELGNCTGRMPWPARGVYFFFEPGETRRESGQGLRVVRVGTHALKEGSRATLWNRLSAHRGSQRSGGGNHRGSIFRLLVGASLMEKYGTGPSTWGRGSSAPRAVRDLEVELERRVSETLGRFTVLHLAVEDPPGPGSLRGLIERNAIALLSNSGRASVDPASEGWLGLRCPRVRVQSSGLWNQNHVDEDYDPVFLQLFEERLNAME